MKAKHSILLLSGLLCIAACSDNDNPAEPVSGESESTPFVHSNRGTGTMLLAKD